MNRKRLGMWLALMLLMSVMSGACVNQEDIPVVNVEQETAQHAQQTPAASAQIPEGKTPAAPPDLDSNTALEGTQWKLVRVTVGGRETDLDAYLEAHQDSVLQLSFRDGMITITFGSDSAEAGSVLTDYTYENGIVSVIYPRANAEDAVVELPVENGMIRIDLLNGPEGDPTGTALYFGYVQ